MGGRGVGGREWEDEGGGAGEASPSPNPFAFDYNTGKTRVAGFPFAGVYPVNPSKPEHNTTRVTSVPGNL